MGGRNSLDGQGAEVDVLYARANERVAKAVAFLGTYLIWGALGLFACSLTLLSL
jgi:hypothetical protein